MAARLVPSQLAMTVRVSSAFAPLGPLQIWLGNRVNLADGQFQMSGVDPGPEPRSFIGREGAERLQG